MSLTTEVLESPEEAASLLYEVYFDELGWDPPGPNPSDLVADHAHRRFVDRYTDRAIWIGVRRGDEVVGTSRLLRREPEGLELEQYVDLPPSLLEGAVEVNRLAVREDVRSEPVLAMLYDHAYAIARSMGARCALGAVSEDSAYGVAYGFGWRPMGRTFRYHPTDPAEAHVVRYALESK